MADTGQALRQQQQCDRVVARDADHLPKTWLQLNVSVFGDGCSPE